MLPVFRPPPVTPMSNVGKSFFTSNPTKTLYRNPNFNSTPISTITQCLSSMGINLAAACQIIDMDLELSSALKARLRPTLEFLVEFGFFGPIQRDGAGDECPTDGEFSGAVGKDGRTGISHPCSAGEEELLAGE
ncbi:SNF2 domain-containing protein, partial [Striga asiatica]